MSCSTGRAPLRDDTAPAVLPPLSGSDAGEAEALARYSQFLLLQEEQPESDAIPGILRRAAEADPSQLAFPLWMGQASIARGRAKEAIPDLEAAVRRFPESDALLYLLGISYEAADRFDEARRAYRQLVRRTPAQPDAYLRLAGLALREDDPDAAFAILDEALRMVEEPLNILVIYEHLGDQFLASRKPWLAAICYSRLVDRQPDNAPARERLMKSRLAAGDKAGALRELEVLAEGEPKGEWYALMGDLAEDLEDAAAAETWYRKAIAAGAPAAIPIRLGILLARSDFEKGLATLRDTARSFPSDPQPAVAAGALLLNAGRPADAVAEFQAAEARLQVLGREAKGFISPLYYFWYGVACDQSGQTNRAEDLFLYSIEKFPEVSESYNYLAYVWAEKSIHLDRALELAQRAVELKPDSAAYLDTLGWVLFRQGKLDDALAFIRKAAERSPDAEILLHLGDILHAMGRKPEARASWKRSAAKEPGGGAAARLRGAGAP